MCEEKLNYDLKQIVSDRMAKDRELFFVNTSVVSSKFGKDIIKKKKFQGVRHGERILIHPIYESVDIVSDDIAVVRLKKAFALFSLHEGSQLTDFEYCNVDTVNDMIVLGKENGRAALYSMRTSGFFHKSGDYEHYNLKDSNTEYVWARRERFYDYIHRATGRIISLPGVIMAYDTVNGIFGLAEDNRVCLYDECGVADHMGLRRAVMQEGGHLTLFNYTYNIRHIIDVYGNILNI